MSSERAIGANRECVKKPRLCHPVVVYDWPVFLGVGLSGTSAVASPCRVYVCLCHADDGVLVKILSEYLARVPSAATS